MAHPKNLFSIAVSVLFALSSSSCGHVEKRFQEKINAGQCGEALEQLPEKDPMVKLIHQYEQAANTVASYALVGAGYTVEVTWDVVGGTVMFVALCGPGLVALTAASVAGGVSGLHSSEDSKPVLCIPGKISALGAPPLGRKARAQAHELRCPNLRGFSRSLRAVASCYESRGGSENLQHAKQTLEAVRASENFYDCMPPEERDLVLKKLEELRLRSI